MTRLVPGIAKVLTRWRDWPTCANPACKTQSLVQAVSKRYTGIRLYEQWFCGAECFEKGARQKVLELLSDRNTPERPAAMRMPLGLLLVSREVLTDEQLKTALDQQRLTGANLGEVVQELGFATQRQVTAAVAAQWACSVFTLGDRPLPAEIHIPACLLQMYEMLPVHFSEVGRKLMVGFVTRVQHHILYAIEQMTNCATTPCFIPANEYHKHIQPLMVAAVENEIVFDGVNNVAEIAKLVRNYVNQTGAEQTRFGMCREHLWVRIIGRHEMDLLFRTPTD